LPGRNVYRNMSKGVGGFIVNRAGTKHVHGIVALSPHMGA
jgi:hypothetical protein